MKEKKDSQLMNYKKRLFYSFSALTFILGGAVSASEVAAEVPQAAGVNTSLQIPETFSTYNSPSYWNPSHPWWNITLGNLVIKDGVVLLSDGYNTSFGNGGGVERVIDYVYEDGTAAAESSEICLGGIGSFSYDYFGRVQEVWDPDELVTFPSVTSPEIEGYTADILVVPELSDYALRNGDQHVTVTYRKNEESVPVEETPAPADETPVDPSVPEVETPIVSSEPTPIGNLENLTQIPAEPIITAASPGLVVAEPKADGARLLPATGDEGHGTAILAAGVSMLAAGAVGLAAQSRRKKL